MFCYQGGQGNVGIADVAGSVPKVLDAVTGDAVRRAVPSRVEVTLA